MSLLESKPDSTYRMESYSISTSFSLHGVELGVSWTYTTPDVLIRNQSNNGTGLYKIWYDVNEDTVYEDATVIPGYKAKVSSASQFVTEEKLTVRFEGPTGNRWFWQPETELVSYTLTIDAILN